MNEAETRAEFVDPALKVAGWGVVEGSRILREYPITLGRIEGHGKRAKPDIADYVLVYRNHKLAVVEAKAWDRQRVMPESWPSASPIPPTARASTALT
jgi:type I restriction enzyme, R subunit